MNKKMLSFIMLFMVAFCFIGGCKDNEDDKNGILVKDGKDVVATINNIDYTADLLYGDMANSNVSSDYLYETLEDLLIKSVVTVTDSMKNRINNEIEKWKKEIKENSIIKGTSYKDDLKAALEAEGVETEEELVDKKIFELQEEIIVNQYWEENKDRYYNEYINNNYVYHISQILVKVSTNGNKDYFDVEPSETVAKKIYDVTNSLLSGEKFYQVAQRYSDDTATKENGGDMGLVTLNDTTISDEVKYALASYSIYFEDADLEYPEYLDEVYGDGFEAIPQQYVDLLGEKYNEDSGVYHITSTSGTVSLYSRVQARNILFNNLYNSRTFRLLQVNEDIGNSKELSNVKMPLIDVAGFEEVASSKKVVTNEEKLPILVVRSNEGIHFISINKSAFSGEEELLKYYAKEVNDSDNYISYVEKAINNSDKESRISNLESLAKDYSIMKISGNSNFAGNEDFIKYDMFTYYLNKFNEVRFEIKDKSIENKVLNYIEAQKNYIKLKIKYVFDGGYEKLSNSEEKFANSIEVTKHIPILKCLDNKACTYTHDGGFKPYNVGGGE